ncbi:MAG: serine--tRNA ligase, partial [Parcubacteria group bacterium]|nr:serine--tRNA ligase [Parcubacteria group bacterium]
LKEQELLVAIQEYLLQKLEIPYQVVLKCTGDMGGKADYRAIDIECYMPGEGKYRETHTSDYMTDYQSRRLKTKYKDSEGNKNFVHMNDATCFAIGRTLIAILENYQKEDGSIEIPKVLQGYMGGLKKID